MNVSKEISADIMLYLQKKGQSIDSIAKSMSTSPEFIQFVIDKKLQLTSKHIDSYLKNANILFWRFAMEAIPMGHLPKKAKKRVMLCKEINDHIEKNKKNQ